MTDRKVISLLRGLAASVRGDPVRWLTILCGVSYCLVSIGWVVVSSVLVGYTEFKDVGMAIVVIICWGFLWTVAVRFLDGMSRQLLSFLMLIGFGLLVIWSGFYSVAGIIFPVFALPDDAGYVSQDIFDDLVRIFNAISFLTAVAVSALRPSRLSAVYAWVVNSFRRDYLKWSVILGGMLWPGRHLSIVGDLRTIYLADHYDMFDVYEGAWTWGAWQGLHLLYIEAIAIVLMLSFAMRMEASQGLRIAARAVSCAVVLITYALSFPWEVSYLAWSAPSLILLLGAPIWSISIELRNKGSALQPANGMLAEGG